MEQLADHYSSSSSIDSSNRPPFLPSSSSSSSLGVSSNIINRYGRETFDSKRDLSTDLRLGLSISPLGHNDAYDYCSTSSRRDEGFDWPPIKPLLRYRLADKYQVQVQLQQRDDHASLFVKVYMEGMPIGRKLDLYAHEGYSALIATLAHMFKTTILCTNGDGVNWNSEKHHVLTYEDKEGDWMLVGDVPWEMFLSTVKRLKITRADKC